MLAIYMVGSDLEDGGKKGPARGLAGTKDLRELISGYNSLPDKREVEVIVAFGGADKDGWRGMKFANMSQIIEDGKDSEFGNETGPDAYLHLAPNADMDDEDSLKLFLDYIRDGYANFDLRFLTFWDHGASYEGFGGDTNFDPSDPMSMDEIASAFTRSEVGEFDIIGFDACFMASMEVAKVVEPHADYMIASEEFEPGHGWLWNDVIQLYAEESGIIKVGKGIVDSFVHGVHYPEYPDEEDPGKTLSLLDLSQYGQLVAALNPVLSAYDQNLLSSMEYSDSLIYGSSAVRSYRNPEREDSRVSIDLMHFAQLLAADAPDADTSANLDALMVAIDKFVVYYDHHASRQNSFGIAIDAPENYTLGYEVSDAWLDFQDTYYEWHQSDTTSPQLVASDSGVDPQSLQFAPDVAAPSDTGLAATFEDEHLAEAVALYGFVEQAELDDGSVGDYFMVVAELEAYPTETEGEYFIPGWDQYWFTVEYDPNQQTAWIPASFADRFEDGGQEYTLYESEIGFYPEGENTYDLGVLTLVVDEYMEVVDYDIRTYQEYEDGEIRFDKASYEIIPGDAIQFWNFGFHLEDESLDGWFPTADGIVTFVQDPFFQLEYLEFEDEFGQIFDYGYGLWAEDASGNADLYGPIPTSPPTAVYEDPLGYFAVEVPADWIEENSDTANYEVFRASEFDRNGSISISAKDGAGLSLVEYTDQVESWLKDDNAQDITLDYYDDSPGVWFEYAIGDTAGFWLFHVFDDGTVVDVIYTFPADQFEAGRDIAYRSFESFSVGVQ